jgi:flagellar motor switch protein FliN/FliY
MSLSEESAELEPGTLLADAQAVEGYDVSAAIPSPRAEPAMGPTATDLPPLPAPDLPELGVGAGPGDVRDLRLLADVQVELAVEIGRVKLPLRDLLSLAPGAVLELDRAADAPVDVLVNGCLVARGEVVVIDGEFGVRVTAVVER